MVAGGPAIIDAVEEGRDEGRREAERDGGEQQEPSRASSAPPDHRLAASARTKREARRARGSRHAPHGTCRRRSGRRAAPQIDLIGADDRAEGADAGLAARRRSAARRRRRSAAGRDRRARPPARRPGPDFRAVPSGWASAAAASAARDLLLGRGPVELGDHRLGRGGARAELAGRRRARRGKAGRGQRNSGIRMERLRNRGRPLWPRAERAQARLSGSRASGCGCRRRGARPGQPARPRTLARIVSRRCGRRRPGPGGAGSASSPTWPSRGVRSSSRSATMWITLPFALQRAVDADHRRGEDDPALRARRCAARRSHWRCRSRPPA